MAGKEVAYIPHWLKEGENDPFPDYLGRDRSELPMADFSDDALGNYLFMNYDRTVEQDVAIMMQRGRGMEIEHVPRITMATAIKERLRWLSRQLLLLQGQYPGKERAPQIDAEKVWEFIIRNDKDLRLKPWSLRWKAIQILPEAFVDEKMQPLLQDLIQQGVIDENGEELPPADASPKWMGSRYMYRMPPTALEQQEAERQTAIEVRAEEIYNSWSHRIGFDPWVKGRDSEHQQEARRQAKGQLLKERDIPPSK